MERSIEDYGGLLQQLVRCEAKEAEWGSKASSIRKEICEKYADLHKGDKVIVHRGGRTQKGIIYQVNYRPRAHNAFDGFVYFIRAVRKDGTMSTMPRQVHYSLRDRIEKIPELPDKEGEGEQ